MLGRLSHPSARRLLGLASALLAIPALARAEALKDASNAPDRPLPAPIRAKLADGEERTLDEPLEAARFALRKRLPAGETALSPERYFAALEHMRAMPQHSIAAKTFLPSRAALAAAGASKEARIDLGTWTPLGPGNIGGRTRSLLIDPRRPQTFYAAGVAGGVWKSVNAGANWAPVGDLLPNLAVTSLVFDPTDSRTLYAGTGEGFFNFDAVRGAGILKSTDAGATWTRLAATNNPNFHFVNDLIVSSRARNRLYAATRTGVWRSTNGGASWTRILDPHVGDGCLDLAIRTDKASDVVFASCGNFASGTVRRNLKAESTSAWTAVLHEAGMGRTALAIAPSHQDTIYALADSLAGGGDYRFGLHAVFRSTNGGASWTAQVRNTSATKLDTLLLTNPVFASLLECGFSDANVFLNQGWYDNVLAVDPKDPNRVFAGGVDLFRSDDAGRSWGPISYWWAEDPTGPAPSFAHADNHALVFHPQYNGTTNQILYAGNDGGLFVTRNARAKKATGLDVCDPAQGKVAWRNLNHGYEVTQFYDGAAFPDGKTYFGGSQDNGTSLGTEAGGRNWKKLVSGDGGYVAVNPEATNILYVETTGISILKSVDGGAKFDGGTNGIDDPASLFIAPFILDRSSPSHLWTGGTFIWRTDDGADFWSSASTAVAGDGDSIVSALAVAPSNSNRVLVGLSRGYVHRNDHALSASNEDWPFVRIRDGFVSSLAFSPSDDRVAYATFSTFGGRHVWKTADGGATWAAIDGSGATGLPDVPALSIVPDVSDPDVLYLGTDLGVFATRNGGASWAIENTGFANVPTDRLDLVRGPGDASTLFAFTHGRGAWRVRIDP
ncbi:MAG TPA: hypothetical protein VN783_17540 [Thermoanaerobaculia bacterium]|nr:hypothetical protein [Thermoanaerobaculia bacterium]